jgi:transglutaminase-like putative cysteine protease
MIYRLRHITTYDYEDPVSVSHHILRLSPHNSERQTCRQTGIEITPKPSTVTRHIDYFGNATTCFTLLEPHDRLRIEASSELSVQPYEMPDFAKSPAWETVRDSLPVDFSDDGLEAAQFIFDSSHIKARPSLKAYAQESFPAGRPVLEGALSLTERIFRDFRFDSKATEVSTPVETFFEKRRGVCQDFSHLEIACMRSLGLPARYVSGYLRTYPPAGHPRLIGADASHAWCSAWSPGIGWVDFDPTNNCVPSEGHITIAWGRDYSDISPVHGVLLGGARHSLETGVDVMPLDGSE